MIGKMFLVDKETVSVRNSPGEEVDFGTIDDFYYYYSGTIDLSGEYYIDYEPEKKLFYYNNDPSSFEPLSNRYDTTPFVQEYEDVIADVENMKEKLDDPYFGKSFEEALEYKLTALKSATFGIVSIHMPQWRQLKWNEYVKIYEKHERGDVLTALEQAIFDGFPDPDETHQSCYLDALSALGWILQCVAANNEREAELKNVSDIEEIKNIADAAYPAWPLS